jgi:hypothetical protein
MIMTYKLLSDSDTSYSAKWFEKAAARRPTRNNGGHNNLVVGWAEHNYRRHFFSIHVPEIWNGLPDPVKEAGTVSVFKSRLRKTYVDTVAQTQH